MTHNLTLALEALRQGRLILVTDDKDRENEGDLICAAEHATPENLNFMATYGRGLICMPMEAELAKRLHLHPMVSENTDPHATAFTVSIDHVSNSTGISAYDRSATRVGIVHLGIGAFHRAHQAVYVDDRLAAGETDWASCRKEI